MGNALKRIKFIKSKNFWLLVIILLIAAFFRLYRVKDYIVFLGDEGRDVLVVKRILEGDLTLLGPTASVGGFYLGPIYYYMMAPFLCLFNYDPVGPAYLVVLLGIATVYLVYLYGKKFFNKTVSISAAFLYALAPLTVRYSRASWNPNPLPFFALLGVYLLSLGIKNKQKLLYFLAGACLGVAWQLHYLALILTGVYGMLALNLFPSQKWLNINLSFKNIKTIISRLLVIFIGWVTTFSPFLAFEIRHNFPNSKTVWEFITRKGGAVDYKLIDILTSSYARIVRLFFEAFSVKDSILLIVFAFVAFLTLIYTSRKRNKSLLVWFLVGILGMAMYQGNIHNYYFGFLFPVPYLMAGTVFYQLSIRGKVSQLIGVLGLLGATTIFFQNAFFQAPPSRLIQQTQTVSKIVVTMAEGKPYNFALASTGNSDHAYRYFLEFEDNQPKLLEDEVTEQLIVVCEQPIENCDPRGHPLWEIAGFGRKEIDAIQEAPAGGVSIIRTIHHQSSLDLIGKPAKRG